MGRDLFQTGRFDEARNAIEEAVGLLAEWGPPESEAWARTLLAGLLPYYDSDLSGPLAEMFRATEVFRDDGNEFGLATGLGMLGTMLSLVGRADEARFGEAIEMARRLGAPTLVGANQTLQALGRLAVDDVAGARRCLEVAADSPLYVESTALWLEGFAAVALAEGDVERAATAYGAAEALRERPGSRGGRSSG